MTVLPAITEPNGPAYAPSATAGLTAQIAGAPEGGLVELSGVIAYLRPASRGFSVTLSDPYGAAQVAVPTEVYAQRERHGTGTLHTGCVLSLRGVTADGGVVATQIRTDKPPRLA